MFLDGHVANLLQSYLEDKERIGNGCQNSSHTVGRLGTQLMIIAAVCTTFGLMQSVASIAGGG